MLFTENQLQMQANPLNILDDAVYLSESEASIHPQMIPIVENSRLQSYIIDLNGIRRLSESAGCGYLDALVTIAESNGIDLDHICVAIDEAELIENPELAEIGPIVVRPLQEMDKEYKFCLEALNAYIESGDEIYLDAITEEGILNEFTIGELLGSKNAAKVKSAVGGSGSKPSVHSSSGPNSGKSDSRSVWDLIPSSSTSSGSSGSSTSSGSGTGFGGSLGSKVSKAIGSLTGSKSSSASNSGSSRSSLSTSSGSPTSASSTSSGMGLGKKAAIGAGVAAAIGGGLLAYKQYQNRPKSVIAKRIAALRQTYAKFMKKAQNASDSGIKNKLKHVAGKILQVIDKLLAYLQKKAD